MGRVVTEAELVDLEARLAKTELALERAEKLAVAGRFAAVTIHEINNPLEAVSNLAYLLKLQQLPDDARTFLEMIDEQLHRIGTITRQTLAFNRSAQKPMQADLVELVSVATRTYSQGLSSKQLRIDLDVPESVFCNVYPGELTQAICNLLSNAIEASNAGGKIQIRIRERTSGCCLSVRDYGCGVPDTMRNSLFDPFVTGKESGNGLGLWVCRRVIEKHGGQLHWKTSTHIHHHGTAFRISLGSPQSESMTIN